MSTFIVLSYGRSGSVLLSQQIKKYFKCSPIYFLKNELNDLIDPVIHSHLLLSTEKTKNYTRIFNLRQDPVETILSYAVVNSGAPRHRLVNEEVKEITPFFHNNQNQIAQNCKQLISWHNFYQSTLTELDSVVVYENLVEQLTSPATFIPTYPDKEKILLNYDDIVNYIQKNYLSEMIDSQQKFLNHQGVDTYKYINC
jgi:hypothetical protein